MSLPIRIVQPPPVGILVASCWIFADCCRSHRNVEQRKPKSGHWNRWSHCVPKWRLASRCHQQKSQRPPQRWMCGIFDHMSLLFFVPFFGTYLDPKQKYVENLWEFPLLVHGMMQEVLRLVGISLCLPDMEKLSDASMTCPLKPLETSAIFMCSSQDKLLKGTKFLGWSSWWVNVLRT